MLAGPLVALVTVIAGLVATDAAGVPLRDPDHVAALYLVLVGAGVALLVGLDIAIRARRRTPGRRLSRADDADRPPRALDARRARWPRASRWSAST